MENTAAEQQEAVAREVAVARWAAAAAPSSSSSQRKPPQPAHKAKAEPERRRRKVNRVASSPRRRCPTVERVWAIDTCRPVVCRSQAAAATAVRRPCASASWSSSSRRHT